MNRQGVESVVRKVLLSQLGISVKIGDNLIKSHPDLPTDEVLKDALELLGLKSRTLEYDSWDGSISGLVDILENTIEKNKQKETQSNLDLREQK
jgi:hypothetical protein